MGGQTVPSELWRDIKARLDAGYGPTEIADKLCKVYEDRTHHAIRNMATDLRLGRAKVPEEWIERAQTHAETRDYDEIMEDHDGAFPGDGGFQPEYARIDAKAPAVTQDAMENATKRPTLIRQLAQTLGASPEVIAEAVANAVKENGRKEYKPEPVVVTPKRERPTWGREVALFDLHQPHNIPLDPILAFLGDYKPDLLILGGDALDAGPFSHWNRGMAGTLRNLPLPKEMFESFVRDILIPLRHAVGDSCYIEYLLGNHEDWIRQALEEDPRGEGFWNIEANCGGIPDDITPYAESNKVSIRYNHFKFGKLIFLHGYRTGIYHARYVADDYNRPVRYGHVHDLQSYTHRTAVDVDDFHVAQSCGCLCDLNPIYAKSRPSRWCHAFQYGEVEPDGSFFDEVPVIVGGRFMAGGVKYGV